MPGKDKGNLIPGLYGLKETIQRLQKLYRTRIDQAGDLKAQLPSKASEYPVASPVVF